ncbi:MAG: hypothetical protein Q9P01_21585 [Anaerolineae bacterium]|nr:hypothetical protein [Anaerolineae bacterium]MDQ7037337.1 hypothetical protein [Anaerolineae bacterium]
MSDNEKKIDETLEDLGFSTMSEDEQKALDAKRDPKPKRPRKQKGVPDEEFSALSVRVKSLLDALPHPMESDIWITEVSELQSQMRSCLSNEIFDRFIDYKRHKLFKVFIRELDEDDEQLALMFPITLALIVYNAFYDPDAAKDENAADKPDLLEGAAFKKQTFFALVEQIMQPDKFMCDNVHPHVSDFLDDVSLNSVESLVTPEQYSLAEILAREVMIRIYADALAFLFKPRITNGTIMKMLTAVIILAFATNKHVTTTMSDML